MPRKVEPEGFVLDLSRYDRRDDDDRMNSLALVMPDGRLTQTEIRVLEQALEKALLIRVEAEISLAGQDFMAEIDRHSYASFATTLDLIREEIETTRPEEDRRNLDAFRRVVTQRAADHLLGANKIGAAQIAEIMQRPISTSDVRGLMARIVALLRA